jgi:hypothetical protein
LLLFLLLDAALLFDVKAAIMGWLLLAVQHYKQHPQHNDVFVIKFNCKFESLLNETNKVNEKKMKKQKKYTNM